MKTIAFKTTSEWFMSLIPDKITAIVTLNKDETKIFVVGDKTPFIVKGSYKEIMKRIGEA